MRMCCTRTVLVCASLLACDGAGEGESDSLGRAPRDASVRDDDDAGAEQEDTDAPDGGAGFDATARADGGTASALKWLACETRDLGPGRVISADVRSDDTWSGTVLVKGARTVSGEATLTIEPGTTVLMDTDSSLEIGSNSSAPRIVAAGTEEAPIRFCGRTAETGAYGGVVLRSNVKSDSVLSHVLFADGGGDGSALVLEAAIEVRDVQVQNSLGNGVRAADFKRGSAAPCVAPEVRR